MPPAEGIVEKNRRPEYGMLYRQAAGAQRFSQPEPVDRQFSPLSDDRREILLIGSAGQRIITAGEILSLAGMTAGLQATQKNEYHITVLRGPSISEVILSSQPIAFTGLDQPDVVIVLGQEGVARRKPLFADLHPQTLVLKAQDTAIPPCPGVIHSLDFKKMGIKPADRALAALAVLAKIGQIIDTDMLRAALRLHFKEKILAETLKLVERVIENR